MKRNKCLLLLLCIVLTMSLLVGCKSKESDKVETPTPVDAPKVEAEAEPEQEQEEIPVVEVESEPEVEEEIDSEPEAYVAEEGNSEVVFNEVYDLGDGNSFEVVNEDNAGFQMVNLVVSTSDGIDEPLSVITARDTLLGYENDGPRTIYSNDDYSRVLIIIINKIDMPDKIEELLNIVTRDTFFDMQGDTISKTDDDYFTSEINDDKSVIMFAAAASLIDEENGKFLGHNKLIFDKERNAMVRVFYGEREDIANKANSLKVIESVRINND